MSGRALCHIFNQRRYMMVAEHLIANQIFVSYTIHTVPVQKLPSSDLAVPDHVDSALTKVRPGDYPLPAADYA